jgi:alpha-amylase/alpha-mannosidase (GH57 family)
MSKVSLLFGIHMHQPVDNFGHSVDEAIELCYAPFFETMIKYPDFKFAVHCSGWLLNEIKEKHPKIFSNMKKLTKKGSIEWVSAGYYEPVLSAIPSRDRQAQINKLNTFIEKNLKSKPQGLWLTERVWESAIVPDLNACDIKYAVVDDYHFLSSGFDADKMDGYYTTEEGGYPLALFPISQSLRYALPFFSVKRAIDAILECKKGENSAAIIFDDAEKFGLWPETHEWVYEKKWLEGFVEAVLENKQIKTEHYSSYLEKNRSKGIAYLNNTSYFEMGEWSLKSEQTLALEALKEQVGSEYFEKIGVAFIKGGIWKNFFVKYHESNYLHKRMLSHSINQNRLKKSALESLYKLQTNDVFWHGVFGGLYLPNLRDNAYTYLLEIERSLAKKKISYTTEDMDRDGYDELKVLTSELSLVLSSRYGGQLIEFGSLERLFNWQNTLMRRKEAYHEKILNPKESLHVSSESEDEIATIHSENVIDESLKDELIYDWHPKNSFIDHFSPNPFELDRFKKASFHEVGDFANQAFELDEKSYTFSRYGGIYLDKKYETQLKKEYSFSDNSLSLSLTCKSDYREKLYYANEFNFHLAHPHLATLNGEKIAEGLELKGIDTLEIADTFTQKKLTLKFTKSCDLVAYTLKTISQSESGFDRVSQQISLLFSLSFKEHLDLEIDLGVSDV